MTSATAPAQSPALVRRKPPTHVRRRRLLVAVADHSLLIVAALVFLAPFVFIVLTAFMTNEQALSPDLWPHPFRWQNFADVFHEAPALALGAELAHLRRPGDALPPRVEHPGRLCARALRWRGRDAAFLVVLVALMLPPQVTVVPLYVMWAKLGNAVGFHFIGTLWPLIIPNWLGDAFSIFLLRQFFLTIPDEYLDAARVDGCGEFRILTTVVLRLTKPAIAAVALFSFLFCFNDFFGPLLYTGESPDNWTLSVGLAQFRTIHQVQWNLTMAATLIVIAPVVLLFFLAQRAFVEGVTLTGVKG